MMFLYALWKKNMFWQASGCGRLVLEKLLAGMRLQRARTWQKRAKRRTGSERKQNMSHP
jgi:hypothetical protein